MSQPTSPDPLSGTRVLDLTTVIMGPYGTRILGDMGADVVKIESPEDDSFRAYGPARHEGIGGSILNLHRNKRSVRLDLKLEHGRHALQRLIAAADVLVHNRRPKAAVRLGLDWTTVGAINRASCCAPPGASVKRVPTVTRQLMTT